jgi:hypothetical protein
MREDRRLSLDSSPLRLTAAGWTKIRDLRAGRIALSYFR